MHIAKFDWVKLSFDFAYAPAVAGVLYTKVFLNNTALSVSHAIGLYDASINWVEAMITPSGFSLAWCWIGWDLWDHLRGYLQEIRERKQ